jgi:hypothetical protein
MAPPRAFIDGQLVWSADHGRGDEYVRLSSLVPRFRAKRMAVFRQRMSPWMENRILDVGGSAQTWQESDLRTRVVILNLARSPTTRDISCYVQGDALRLPFRDKSFGLVVSNSVLEHVGDFVSQLRFAEEIRRVGVRYWVQSPNRYFPLEPHFLFPGFQFLPLPLKRLVGRSWPFSWPKRYGATRSEIDQEIRAIRLLTPNEMRRLFPDGLLYREKFLGLTKALIVHSPVGLPPRPQPPWSQPGGSPPT